MRKLISVLAVIVGLAGSWAVAEEPLFRDGDRIVWLGNTLIEREQEFARWEAELILAHPGKSLQFRNLGWSGDTVWSESRGMFDPPSQGYQRMLELVRELQPTVIIFGYGGVEAFAGEEGLSRFAEQYRKLVDEVSTDETRRVHLSPLLIEARSLPIQSPQAFAHAENYNASVTRYADAIGEIARERNDRFVNLAEFQQRNEGPAWTENGIHLHADGYAVTAGLLANSLGLAASKPAKADELQEFSQAIIEKNRLFFHRWRPQNFTYLFGFRKHEQGQNAAEIARFDPLIAAAEVSIREIRDRIHARQSSMIRE